MTRSLGLLLFQMVSCFKMCMALHHSFTRSRVQVCGCVGDVAEKALDGVKYANRCNQVEMSTSADARPRRRHTLNHSSGQSR
jgi:hypothetical protein